MKKYRHKEHPKRNAYIWGVKLVGHERVEITFNYQTESGKYETCNTQTFSISMCAVARLVTELVQITRMLQKKLWDFADLFHVDLDRK